MLLSTHRCHALRTWQGALAVLLGSPSGWNQGSTGVRLFFWTMPPSSDLLSRVQETGLVCLPWGLVLSVRLLKVNFQPMRFMSLSKLCCDLVALQILKKCKGLSVSP